MIAAQSGRLSKSDEGLYWERWGGFGTFSTSLLSQDFEWMFAEVGVTRAESPSCDFQSLHLKTWTCTATDHRFMRHVPDVSKIFRNADIADDGRRVTVRMTP